MSTSRPPSLALSAVIIAALAVPSCTLFSSRAPDARTRHLQLTIVETPEDRDEQGYVWIEMNYTHWPGYKKSWW